MSWDKFSCERGLKVALTLKYFLGLSHKSGKKQVFVCKCAPSPSTEGYLCQNSALIDPMIAKIWLEGLLEHTLEILKHQKCWPQIL